MASRVLRCCISHIKDINSLPLTRTNTEYSKSLLRHRQQQILSKPVTTESQSPEQGNQELLKLSDACVNKLKNLNTGKYLRLMVEGGGCSGFQYTFQMDESVDSGDIVIEKDGVRVVFDQDSLEFIKGSTLDYHEELIRSSFRVINNPQADIGCSCGASFSLKL